MCHTMEKGAWNREKKEEKQDVEKNSYIFFTHVTRKTWPIDTAKKGHISFDMTLQNVNFIQIELESESVHKWS